jgi:hypothetical protein
MWTTPRTWTVSEVVTAAIMNTHVRDNLNYIYSYFKTTDPVLSQVTRAEGSANIQGTVLTTGSISVPSDWGAVYVEAWGAYIMQPYSAGWNDFSWSLSETTAGDLTKFTGRDYYYRGNGPVYGDYAHGPFYLRSKNLAWAGTSRTVNLNFTGYALAMTTSWNGYGANHEAVLRVVRAY